MMRGMATATVTPLFSRSTAASVGGRIRQARKFADLSQQALADAVGASRDSVSNWERGEHSPSVDMLLLIAQAIDVPATWFLEGVAPSPTGPEGGATSEDRLPSGK